MELIQVFGILFFDFKYTESLDINSLFLKIIFFFGYQLDE